MYIIGDYVVYRGQNVCKIEEICRPTFETDKTKEYYKLSPAFDNPNDTTIYVPVDTTDGLRHLIQREDAELALNESAGNKAAPFQAKKPQLLAMHYNELLAKGDPKSCLTLLKEISAKEKSTPKKVNEIDLRFKKKTEKLLTEEFSLVLNISLEKAKNKIIAAIQ